MLSFQVPTIIMQIQQWLNFTVIKDGLHMHVCLKCQTGLRSILNAMHVLYHPPTYANAIIGSHPFHIQLLSFLDIGLHIQSRKRGFFGVILDTSLLNSPLLSWDSFLDRGTIVDNVGDCLGPILKQNMESNPKFQEYLTVCKQP